MTQHNHQLSYTEGRKKEVFYSIDTPLYAIFLSEHSFIVLLFMLIVLLKTHFYMLQKG